MTYKLINAKTSEEHLCNKVTIDGFDYYIRDNNIEEIYPQLVVEKLIDSTYCIIQIDTINDIDKERQRRIVATNNPNIDIPKVVDEIEILAMNMLKTKWSHLYTFGYPKRPFPIYYENDLNCVLVGLYKAKETYSFSEEDVKWIFAKAVELSPSVETRARMGYQTEYLRHVLDSLYSNVMKLWEAQKPKIVYYA